MKIDNVEFFMTRVLSQSYVMTDLNLVTSARTKVGVPGMKKTTLRIDMTPMVDLGFLLIAFFIFTTEISKPASIKLFMPHDGNSIKARDSRSLTILLGKDNHVFYYYGTLENAVKNSRLVQTSYDEITGLGKIIREKQSNLHQMGIDRKELIVLIKPGNESSYTNVVDALDEMLINGVTRYALVDLEKEEVNFLKLRN